MRSCDDWFHVRPVDSEEVWLARWRRDLALPSYRIGGVTGTVEVDGVERRVHVCAQFPGINVHNASKQKKGMLPPRHVRLVHWGPDGGVHEPAVAGGGGPAGDATPPMAPPVDAPVLPPSPQPPPPPTPLGVPVESDAEEGSDSSMPLGTPVGSDASDEDIEDDLPGPDKTALAPAPSPAFLPGEAGQDVLPPGRATLLSIPALVPCAVRVPVPVPAIIEKPAVAVPDSSDDEPMFADTGLTNVEVAADMATFLHSMQTDGHYIGIGAFVLFSLTYRVRVHAWFQGECRDLVNEYAPWANDFITHRPLYDGISCTISQAEGLALLGPGAESMNQWVVATAFQELEATPMDGTLQDVTDAQDTFLAFYLSLNRLVLRTIADGDCGVDGMCLMLGEPRTLASRKNTVRV